MINIHGAKISNDPSQYRITSRIRVWSVQVKRVLAQFLMFDGPGLPTHRDLGYNASDLHI